MKKLIIFVVFTLTMCLSAFAQSPLAELDKLKQIKLLESTREDVKKIFGDTDEDSDGDYYSTENFTIRLDYSNGDCLSEDGDDEWNVTEGKVVEINVLIKDSDESEKLKINLSKLEKINKQEDDEDEEAEEDADDYVYYDKEKGISYGLDDGEIESIKYTPLEKNYPTLCNNEDFKKFNSPEEWFRNKVKDQHHRTSGGRPFASVAELVLSKNEITAYCAKGKLLKAEVCAEDAKIEIAAKGESSDPTDVLTYNYTVSGGKIIGSGENVTWDLTGLKAGTYTITAGVDNGCGVCGNTKTVQIEVKECPDCKLLKK